MTFNEAVDLMEHCHDLAALGQAAHAVRLARHPEPVVTYIVDRNINYSNVCTELCKFCAFYRPKGHSESYILDRETFARKVEELREAGGRQILLQGGIHPDLKIEWYEEMLRWLRSDYPDIAIHGFSAPEIYRFAEISGISLRETIERLRDAGLQSIPGGGAEILTETSRQRISPLKITTDQWFEVMRTAHDLGMRTTATMMLGCGEAPRERIEHLERLRQLQDETGGFTAFICWTFQEENTALRGKVPLAGAHEYLRMLSIARLYLDNFENMQSSWVTQGAKIGQLALFHGANDMGSTMLEENVVSAAGTIFHMDARGIERVIRDAGFRPQQRDFFYNPVEPRVPVGC
ncbi:dehypoxanthine futalosine cyclase [Candidatus Sumerlaeota bacterium]|nr:dehypoxanthine futalosine cyclase [Candidatus Sumerlaeota bacterium]